MLEIRVHGRGGQGAVVASVLLATAYFYEGKYVSSFPFYGVERRGAPVTAFIRMDEVPILIKSQIYKPDFVLVLDQTLIHQVDITAGLKKNGKILINTEHKPQHFKFNFKVITIDATDIAIKHNLGNTSAPIVNTSIVGAFAAASNTIRLEFITRAIKERVHIFTENNVKAAEDSFRKIKLDKW